MADGITGVYSEARTEYTKQLCSILIPSYFQFFLSLLDKAKEEVTKTGEAKKLLWQFQTYLNDIPEWNMEKVNTEIASMQSSCGCDYLEDLLTAVFIAHTKVLTAIRVSNKQKKVQITVPKVEHFLFKVLCETSKLLWGSSFLFRDGISSIEKQQNYRSVEGLLGEGILQAVRAMVPVKNILKDFVSVDDDEKEEEEEEKKETKEEAKEEALGGIPIPVLQESSIPIAEEPAKEPAPIVLEPAIEAANVQGTPEEPKVEEPKAPANEVIVPGPPVIRINTGQSRVGFTQFDTMFDSESADGNDIIEQGPEEEESGLEILEGDAIPLGDGDVESLDLNGKDEAIGDGDYDVLV
jgi:Family of unknown function (DUF5764)